MPLKNPFFTITTLFLLVLSVIAFSDNLFYDVGQESNSDPKFVIHGIFFLVWFVMLVVQSNFIRKGDYKAHMRWGMWGMAVAAGVVLSTFYIFYVEFKGWDVMPGHVKSNRIFTVTFAILVLLAYLKRKRPLLHKRFLWIGTVLVLGPVIGRVAGKLGDGSDMSYILFEAVIWNGLFLSLIAYDWMTLKKVHWVTLGGVVWFYLVWVSYL